jgi:inner membrane protein
VYGDAVFVLEPWLWAILGMTVALNAARLSRLVAVLVTMLPIGALAWVGLLQTGVLAIIGAVVGGVAFVARAWDRKRRAAVALVATAVIFGAMAGVSRLAKAEARRAVATLDSGPIVDIVADANPGAPWCWTVLTLQKAATSLARSLPDVRRFLFCRGCGRLPIAPRRGWGCARNGQLTNARPTESCGIAAGASTSSSCGRFPLPIVACVRGCSSDRAPYVANDRIVDLRFENPIGQNFTPMSVTAGSSACPAYLTNWELPRRDVM